MKILIKQKFTLLAVFLTCFFFPPLHAQANSTHDPFEAKLKIRSFKKTMSDFFKVAQEAGIPNQKLIMPFLLLSLVGHPNYSSLSENHNVCIFFLPTENNPKRKFIFLAKLNNPSDFKKNLENLGWSMTTLSDWSFFSKNPEDLSLIKDKSPLIDYAKIPLQYDFQLILSPGKIPLFKDSLSDLNKLALNTDSFTCNVNVSDDTISLHTVFKYKDKKGPLFNDFLRTKFGKDNVKDLPSNDKNISIADITLHRNQLPSFLNSFQKLPDKTN